MILYIAVNEPEDYYPPECEVCGEPSAQVFEGRPICADPECLDALVDRLNVEDGIY
jgi:hypothetical protein